MDGAVTTDVRGQVRVVEGQERYAVWATPDSHKPAYRVQLLPKVGAGKVCKYLPLPAAGQTARTYWASGGAAQGLGNESTRCIESPNFVGVSLPCTLQSVLCLCKTAEIYHHRAEKSIHSLRHTQNPPHQVRKDICWHDDFLIGQSLLHPDTQGWTDGSQETHKHRHFGSFDLLLGSTVSSPTKHLLPRTSKLTGH